MSKLENDQGKESVRPGGNQSYSTPEIGSSSLDKGKGSQPEPILSDEPASEEPGGSDDSRRKFMKKGLKGAALLPYVTPLIETIFLADANRLKQMAPQVLVIDDDHTIPTSIESVLTRAGHEVETTAYLTTAIGEALLGKYDLITLDLSMPGVSGEEIANLFNLPR